MPPLLPQNRCTQHPCCSWAPPPSCRLHLRELEKERDRQADLARERQRQVHADNEVRRAAEAVPEVPGWRALGRGLRAPEQAGGA